MSTPLLEMRTLASATAPASVRGVGCGRARQAPSRRGDGSAPRERAAAQAGHRHGRRVRCGRVAHAGAGRASCSSCSTRSPASSRSTARSATAVTRAWSPSGWARRGRWWRSTATRWRSSASRRWPPRSACSMRFIRSGYAEALELLGARGRARRHRCTSTWACPRCRSTPASAASPTPTRRRWTCAWTPTQELSAREIVAEWDERRLARALRDFGEERHAGAIARAIVRRREQAPIETTQELVETINSGDPRARALRRRASRQALLPGAADRRQRRARTARPRAAAGLGAAARGRRAGRHLLPLARGPARQALPRRARARLHLPARPARLRLRPRAGGGAADAPLDRALGGGARRQPARRLGAPARARRKLAADRGGGA